MFSLIPQVLVPDNANNIFGNKFLLLPELTTFDRLQIVYEAYRAKIFGLWSTITALSKYYNISKTFIYDTSAVFEKVVVLALGPSIQPADTDNKKEAVEIMSSLRLEGKCGIGSIVTIMNRLGLLVSSELRLEDNCLRGLFFTKIILYSQLQHVERKNL